MPSTSAHDATGHGVVTIGIPFNSSKHNPFAANHIELDEEDMKKTKGRLRRKILKLICCSQPTLKPSISRPVNHPSEYTPIPDEPADKYNENSFLQPSDSSFVPGQHGNYLYAKVSQNTTSSRIQAIRAGEAASHDLGSPTSTQSRGSLDSPQVCDNPVFSPCKAKQLYAYKPSMVSTANIKCMPQGPAVRLVQHTNDLCQKLHELLDILGLASVAILEEQDGTELFPLTTPAVGKVKPSIAASIQYDIRSDAAEQVLQSWLGPHSRPGTLASALQQCMDGVWMELEPAAHNHNDYCNSPRNADNTRYLPDLAHLLLEIPFARTLHMFDAARLDIDQVEKMMACAPNSSLGDDSDDDKVMLKQMHANLLRYHEACKQQVMEVQEQLKTVEEKLCRPLDLQPDIDRSIVKGFRCRKLK